MLNDVEPASFLAYSGLGERKAQRTSERLPTAFRRPSHDRPEPGFTTMGPQGEASRQVPSLERRDRQAKDLINARSPVIRQTPSAVLSTSTMPSRPELRGCFEAQCRRRAPAAAAKVTPPSAP